MSETPPITPLPATHKPRNNGNRAQHINVNILPDDEQTQGLFNGNGSRSDAEITVVNYPNPHPNYYNQQDEDDDDYDCDTDTETDINGLKMKPLNHFRWLERDTSIKLNLSGSDWSPRIEIEAVPSGRGFHHTTCVKREEKSGRLIPDQKLFYLLNTRNQRLLAIDYSTDLKSFHVMEPDSQRFIAFFTLPSYPCDENEVPSPIYIHNVIDGEMYVVDPYANELTIPIKSESGEELAVIMRPPPKWTQSQPGLMTLHFTGDDRDGLTCRERAIILGFFLSFGIQAMSHWKRSSLGILAVYVLSAILGCFFVLFIYVAFRNDYTPLPLNLARQQYEEQQQQQQRALMLLRVTPPPMVRTTPSISTTTTPTTTTISAPHVTNYNDSRAMSLLLSVLTSPPSIQK